MSPTATEKAITQERRSQASGAILVPLLERLLEVECIPEDEEDFRFLDMLVRARALPREKGVFSPSMLGSCIRQAYFSKRQVEKHSAVSAQTNGYFLKGNFVHLQWQFAMWKAHRAQILRLAPVPAETPELDFWGDGTRPAVEVRVFGKHDDFAGTIDVITQIESPLYVVDFKGINLIDFQRTVKNGASMARRTQLVGYGQILNESGIIRRKVTECLLVSECKAGPVSGTNSPLALHETRVPIVDFEAEVKRRLKTLRFYDAKNETPPPACVSTQHMQFIECAFNRFCLEEVKARQKKHEKKAERKHKDFKPARPGR